MSISINIIHGSIQKISCILRVIWIIYALSKAIHTAVYICTTWPEYNGQNRYKFINCSTSPPHEIPIPLSAQIYEHEPPLKNERNQTKVRLHRRAKCKGPKTHKLKCRSLKNIHAWYLQSERYTSAKNKYSKKFTFNTLYGKRLLISFDSNRGVSISRIINSLEMNKRRGYNFREYCSSKRSAIAYYKK